jgi:hypothetical protein
MAKAKKSESAAAPAAKKKAAKPAATQPAGRPLVDTNLAAQAAARRVVAGFGAAGAATGAPMPQSAAFKHMKDSISNPTAGGLGNLLDKPTVPGQKKSNTPFHGGKQMGRNQTFGADVNRAGVPRRTGGG